MPTVNWRRNRFLDNVRIAAGWFNSTVDPLPGAPDSGRITRWLDRADLWLTPKAVEDFEPEDFADSPDCDRLTEAVEAFRRVAAQVPPAAPAPPALRREAMEAFSEIIRIVRPRLELQDEEAQIARLLSGLRLSPDQEGAVAGVRFGLDTDSLGEPAVRVYVVLRDEVAGSAQRFDLLRSLRQTIAETLTSAGIRRYPYVSFVTVTEEQHPEIYGRV